MCIDKAQHTTLYCLSSFSKHSLSFQIRLGHWAHGRITFSSFSVFFLFYSQEFFFYGVAWGTSCWGTTQMCHEFCCQYSIKAMPPCYSLFPRHANSIAFGSFVSFWQNANTSSFFLSWLHESVKLSCCSEMSSSERWTDDALTGGWEDWLRRSWRRTAVA